VNKRSYVRTPLIELNHDGRTAFFKLECDQPSGSFKLRGMDHLVAHAAERGFRMVISSSGGNAGYAAAMAARGQGLQCEVVVPEFATANARRLIAQQGAGVTVHGERWEDADALARSRCESENAFYLSPYDHPALWRGHSTLIDECADEMDPPDAIALSVGGGGLFAGAAQGMLRHDWTGASLIACETQGAACMRDSLEAGEPVTIDKIETVATSLGARRICDEAFALSKQVTTRSHIMSDDAAIAAAKWFEAQTGKPVESACGAAIDAFLSSTQEETQLIIVCGGISTLGS
jgi:L-serine/L-threonine ammonia-lyase